MNFGQTESDLNVYIRQIVEMITLTVLKRVFGRQSK